MLSSGAGSRCPGIKAPLVPPPAQQGPPAFPAAGHPASVGSPGGHRRTLILLHPKPKLASWERWLWFRWSRPAGAALLPSGQTSPPFQPLSHPDRPPRPVLFSKCPVPLVVLVPAMATGCTLGSRPPYSQRTAPGVSRARNLVRQMRHPGHKVKLSLPYRCQYCASLHPVP